jgi:hypothetical protein
VHRNDQITVDEAMALKPAGIVLSPGPRTPNEAGICMDLVKAAARAQVPLWAFCPPPGDRPGVHGKVVRAGAHARQAVGRGAQGPERVRGRALAFQATVIIR